MGRDECPVCGDMYGDEEMRNIYLSKEHANKLKVIYSGNIRICINCFNDKLEIKVKE